VRVREASGDTRVSDGAPVFEYIWPTYHLSRQYCIFIFSSVERCRSTVHNRVQKADLRPTGGPDPVHVGIDETVIQLDDERFWLYVAADSETTRSLHGKLVSTRNQAITEMFLAEPCEKQFVDDALFLVASAP